MRPLIQPIFLLALLLQWCQVQSQTVPVPLDSMLNATLDSMRGVLNVKSLSAAMQFTDESIWAEAKGISSILPLENVTPDHKYLIGSVTKTITSACILQLNDEGILSIDDSLHHWLDTIPFIDPNITIKQLLQHTSGIYDVLSNPNNQDSLIADLSRIWTAEELIDKFIGPPLFAPGTAWSYSNSNYFLLGMIIEEATGHPFYQELRDRFYEPLGLGSFAIPAFEPMNLPVAHVWMDGNGDMVLEDLHDFYFNYLSLNSTAGAAGGYYSTATDCTRWIRKYLRGDLLTPETMVQAKTTVVANGSQGGQYGLGLMKNNFLGNEAYGHGGDLAYHASAWYFPEKDLSITVFTNDNKVTSWNLLAVVRELLRTCEYYETLTPTEPVTANIYDVTISPNPFQHQPCMDIKLEKAVHQAEFIISDAMGKKLGMSIFHDLQAGNHQLELASLQGLPTGVYWLNPMLDGEPMGALKLIKS